LVAFVRPRESNFNLLVCEKLFEHSDRVPANLAWAYRSFNPEASCVTVGTKAKGPTQNHPLQHGYELGSPLSKLCKLKGSLLGAPIGSITVLQCAESIADVLNRQVSHYQMPLLRHGKREWIEIEEFNTGGNVLPNAE
jgi:aminoglycoside 3-N-acetyltransferase